MTTATEAVDNFDKIFKNEILDSRGRRIIWLKQKLTRKILLSGYPKLQILSQPR